MKRVAVAALLVSGLLVLAGAQDAPDPAEDFAKTFSDWLALRKHHVTPEEKEALRKVHRLLLLASREHYVRTHFWWVVSGVDVKPKEIEWSKAKDMILGGEVIRVSQTHSRRVRILCEDGVRYQTREPKLDDVLPLILEVDPKRVFVSYSTE